MRDVGVKILRGIYYSYLMFRDKCRGTDFYASVENGEQGVPDSESGSRYQASSPLYDCSLNAFLKQQHHKFDAIIDVGCGKGRMLEIFSHFDFSKVAGLEYSSELAEIARMNMQKLGLSCEVFIEDATVFNAYDDYNYFYLFNPFPQPIMEKFVEKVKESIAQNPRKVTIIYTNPLCLSVFLESGFSSRWEGGVRHKFCVITNTVDND